MTPGCRIEVSDRIEDPEWDQFVARTDGGHHVQTGEWGVVKAGLGWKAIRMIARSDHGIIAGAQMLVHRYPVLGSVGYVSKGPLLARGPEDPDLARCIISQLRESARSRGLKLIAIQPPDNGGFLSPLLIQEGFRPSRLELAPTASIIVDLSMNEDRIMNQARRQTRQNIRRAQRAGVTIHEGSAADMGTFYDLHLCTSRRQGFLPYERSYFECMRETMEPRGHFQLLLARYEGLPVSALLLVPFRETVVAKILGWSGRYKELRPNEALFWGAIQWAKSRGYRRMDLEGIRREGAARVLEGEPLPESVLNSPDHLKYGFGGTVTLYPEAFEFVPNPVYRWFFKHFNPEAAKRSIITKVLDFLRKR